MAKLYFRYGAMNSGKSIDILKTVYNYEEQDKSVLLFTSALDDRYGQGKVTSRIGISREAIIADENIVKVVESKLREGEIDCIIVDEAQFLSEITVNELCYIAKYLNIPVIAYGLRTDFQSYFFVGSKRLMEIADKIEEIKTVCWNCNEKATMNMRLSDGVPEFDGEQIQIGGNESYIPVCMKCYCDELNKWNSKNKL